MVRTEYGIHIVNSTTVLPLYLLLATVAAGCVASRHGEAPPGPDHVPQAAGHLCAPPLRLHRRRAHPSTHPCARRRPGAQPLEGSARSATASARSATRMCGLALLYAFATNATTGRIRSLTRSCAWVPAPRTPQCFSCYDR